MDYKQVGFYPFRGPDAPLTLAESYHRPVNTRPPATIFLQFRQWGGGANPCGPKRGNEDILGLWIGVRTQCCAGCGRLWLRLVRQFSE